MMRFLACCVMLVAAAALKKMPANPRPTSSVPKCDTSRPQTVVQTPTLLELIINPMEYEGCLVMVAGFLDYAYPTAHLYVSPDDRPIAGVLFGRVDVSLRDADQKVNLEELRHAENGIVFLQGVAKMSKTGPGVMSIDRFTSVKHLAR